MRHWQQGVSFSRNRKARREAQLRRLATMRAAKQRKHEAAVAAGWRPEPKMVRAYPLEFGVRNKATGEVAWADLRSVRQAATALGLILKYY